MSHDVDVVIAVHTPARPVGRAVASVLDGNPGTAVTVVCHHVAPPDIAAVIAPRHRDRVRYLRHDDGIPSPAGPFNAGLRAAGARYVSVLGSDDHLRTGAVASWLRTARRSGAEAVLTRLERPPAGIVPTPPARPLPRRRLHPIYDRLSYRSAPLGLIATETVRRLGLEFVEGIEVGDDVPFVTRLWFEARVAYDRLGPAYVIGEEAAERVTTTRRPIARELAFLRHLLDTPWFRDYPDTHRRAICVKAVRIHLFGAVHNRPDPAWWTDDERRELAAVAGRLLAAAPGVADPLSLADRDLLVAIRSRRARAEEMIALGRRRRRHGTPRTIATRSPAHLLDREGPVRLMGASALQRVPGQR